MLPFGRALLRVGVPPASPWLVERVSGFVTSFRGFFLRACFGVGPVFVRLGLGMRRLMEASLEGFCRERVCLRVIALLFARGTMSIAILSAALMSR